MWVWKQNISPILQAVTSKFWLELQWSPVHTMTGPITSCKAHSNVVLVDEWVHYKVDG